MQTLLRTAMVLASTGAVLLAGHQSFAESGAAGGAPVTASRDTILILDASGSMWGQIKGANKIVIAKDVVEGLVRGLPAQQRVGLVAYGHRREGDCGDIETLADVGAERGKIIGALRELSPKGKTPLTRSVEHAATALNYTKKAATIILVSDGLETCNADPCALARALEEGGLDFTVHVVGFDVTEKERAGLRCIAEETGGRFLAAGDADELTDALAQVAGEGTGGTAAPEGEPVPSTLAMKATILDGGPLIDSGLSWTVTPAVGGVPVFTANGGAAETEIVPGEYVAEAVWTGWRDGKPKKGKLAFTVKEQQPKVITVPIDLEIPVSLSAPATTAEGVAIDVAWSGPDDLGAAVSMNRPDDSPLAHIYFFPAARARTSDKSAVDTDGDGDVDQDDRATAKLGAPTVPGEYEVRYVLNDPALILARRPITVTDSLYAIDAPAAVPVSTRLDIAWSGPLTPGDVLTLVPAGFERPFDNKRYTPLKEGQPAVLTTPETPGDYEIRYVMYGGYTTYPGMMHAVQHTVPITVTDVSASVSAPETAVGGSTIDVIWQGPTQDWQDDFVSVVEPGAEAYNRNSWARISRNDNPVSPAPIRVPAIEGQYEVVYVLQPGGRVMARTPLTVTRAKATVDAPATVKAGEDFEVAWTGDGFGQDRVVVVEAGYPDHKMWSIGSNYGFAATTGAATGKVHGRVVKKPGQYEVRYVTGLQHQVLARDIFTVTE
ncbi:vWA domain-containing protein [Emcibacter sp. SYSU 3D8]|uniref:vWA domain-containing protein n=1 Tax=Emcibacter sp. SYSU 3D8 TaxID=3133969 RepID=UPI0031FEBB52